MVKPAKQTAIYIAFSLIFIIITISTLSYLIISIKKYNINQNSKIINNNQPSYRYLVKDVNGKINIFENNNSKPKIILEKPTIFLPEFDRRLLSKGLYINSSNELNSFIEDYSD